MDFKQVEALTTDTCKKELAKRLASRLPEFSEPVEAKPEELEAELVVYKKEMLEAAIPEELATLIDNNSATIEAFPEAASNHSAWVNDNIRKNKNVEEAVARVKAIKAKEVSLAALQVEAKDLDVRVKRIDKVFRKILVDMAHDELANRGFSEKEIKELKDV